MTLSSPVSSSPKARRPAALVAALALAAGVVATGAGLVFGGTAHAAAGPARAALIADDAAPYELTYATVGECKVGKECVATVTINARGEYHVNESYPFKFTAAADGVEFHGSGGNVHAGGDFARVGPKTGILTVKFKPAAKGKVTISGPYKICICTEKVCQPTVANLSFDVDVKG